MKINIFIFIGGGALLAALLYYFSLNYAQVSKESVQTMAKDDAAKMRGGYRIQSAYTSGVYIPAAKLNSFNGYQYYTGSGNSTLKYTFLRTETTGSLWWKKTVYVAR